MITIVSDSNSKVENDALSAENNRGGVINDAIFEHSTIEMKKKIEDALKVVERIKW